jgi:hypothetical protein
MKTAAAVSATVCAMSKDIATPRIQLNRAEAKMVSSETIFVLFEIARSRRQSSIMGPHRGCSSSQDSTLGEPRENA